MNVVAHSLPRRTGALPIRMLGWLAVASVVAIPLSGANFTCSDFAATYGGGQTWTEFKLQGAQLANGTYTQGPLTVTISNFTDSSSGTPGSFDWSANIGIDAVFVKAG